MNAPADARLRHENEHSEKFFAVADEYVPDAFMLERRPLVRGRRIVIRRSWIYFAVPSNLSHKVNVVCALKIHW